MQAKIVDNSSIRMIMQRHTLHLAADPLPLFAPAPTADLLRLAPNPFLLLPLALAPDYPLFAAGAVALEQV